jgi:aspartate ammonia-lyase
MTALRSTPASPPPVLYSPTTAQAIRASAFSGRTLRSEPALLASICEVKNAYARVNLARGDLDERIAVAIVSAGEQVVRDGQVTASIVRQFPADLLSGASWESVDANVNEVLARLASERLDGTGSGYICVDPLRHVGLGQSCAIVCAAASRMTLWRLWEGLDPSVDALCHALAWKAAEIRSDAELGARFVGAVRAVCLRLDAARRAAMAMLGVPVSPEVADALAAVSGLALRPRCPDCQPAGHSNELAGLSSTLTQVARVLIGVATDTFGLGAGFRPGGSAPADTLLHACFQVIGCDAAVTAAVRQAGAEGSTHENVAIVNLIDATGLLTRAVRQFTTWLRHLAPAADPQSPTNVAG